MRPLRHLSAFALILALPWVAGCPGVLELKSKQAKGGPAKSTVAPILYDDFEKGFGGGWTYACTEGGASAAVSEEDQTVHSGKKAMKVTFKSGTGSWGAGFGWGTPYMPKAGYFNAKGTIGIELWVKGPRGAGFQISLKEGKQNGGDEEVYLAPQGTCTGVWKRYFFAYDGFTRGIYSGNQGGDDRLEIGSLASMDIQIAEKQGDGIMYFDDIYFK